MIRFFSRPILITVFCLSVVVPATTVEDNPQVYELLFWPGVNMRQDVRVVRISEHPCGTVAVARVRTMPSLKRGQPLEPERVVELATGGKVLRRWGTPVDSTPVGISGNRLLVRSGQIKLWIGLDGRITTANAQLVLPIPEQAVCGTSREFGDSGYVECWRFRDLETGKHRLLSFEGVCI